MRKFSADLKTMEEEHMVKRQMAHQMDREIEDIRAQWEQAESRDKRRMKLEMQLKSLQCEKAHLSQELEYLHHRMKSIIGKLSSLRNQNLSDQKEDQSRVKKEIVRMVTRKKSTTREIDLKQPDWRLLFT